MDTPVEKILDTFTVPDTPLESTVPDASFEGVKLLISKVLMFFSE